MAFRFRLDVSRCIGCRACEVACVTANDLNPAYSRNWVPYLEAGDDMNSRAVFAPYLCAHCEKPPCVPACPTGASYKADDGRVLVDKKLCIGCGLCVPACPYQARFLEPKSGKLDKCTLCVDRVGAGLAPACFEVCPAGARTFEETFIRDGRETRVTVGAVDGVDAGRPTTADVDPGPRFVYSGLAPDLDLVALMRRPHADPVPAAFWRNAAGGLVQGLGFAALLAMGGMVGLRALRGRIGKVKKEVEHVRPE